MRLLLAAPQARQGVLPWPVAVKVLRRVDRGRHYLKLACTALVLDSSYRFAAGQYLLRGAELNSVYSHSCFGYDHSRNGNDILPSPTPVSGLATRCSRPSSSGCWACCSGSPIDGFRARSSSGWRRGAWEPFTGCWAASPRRTRHRDALGNQKHYQANGRPPVFEELHGLIVKTSAWPSP